MKIILTPLKGILLAVTAFFLCAGAAVADDSDESALPESQQAPTAALPAGRLVFIDPETGERRAPTTREAQQLQESLGSSRALQTTPPATDPATDIIVKPDGSTMVRWNPRQRSRLAVEVGEDGQQRIGHTAGGEQ